MGLLLATGMSCTAIVGLPAFVLYRLLVWRVTEPHRRNVLQLGIFGVSVVAAALLFPAVTNGVLQSSVVVKHDVTPANYRSVGPSLPAEASHIRFHSDYMGCEATFTMDESAFRRWIGSQGWNAEEITGTKRVDLPRLNIVRSIDNGLIVSERFADRGTGVYMAFDTKTSTCFYRYSSW